MALIGPADYPAVRAAIDVTLDSSSLPSEIIALPIYQGAAEADVLARDPQAATRQGDEQIRIRSATVYLTASYLIQALPQITHQNFAGYSYQRSQQDPAKRAAELRALGLSHIDGLTGQVQPPTPYPTFFRRASGGRGRG